MRNRLDEYYDDKQFLEIVNQYDNEYQDFRELRNAIADELHSIIYNSHGRASELNSYCSEARSLLNAFNYIIDRREEAKDE
jgi:uncharacterized protein YydD (DUF2326 family)